MSIPGGRKLVLAVLVLAAGFLGALQFRKPGLRDSAPATSDLTLDEPVTRRLAPAAGAVQTYKVPTAVAPSLAEIPAPTSQPKLDERRPPSPVGSLLRPLADDFPSLPPARENPLRDEGPSDAPRSHTIEDGDTLTKLADRYLGSVERFQEIYDLNRELLDSPDLLPIGKILKIPPRTRPAARPSEPAPSAAGGDEAAPPLVKVQRTGPAAAK